MRNFLTKLSKKFKDIRFKLGKKSQMAIAGILAIIMLIVFFNGIKSKTDDSKGGADAQFVEVEQPIVKYERELELRLEQIISSINGIGTVEAFVMTDTSIETIYAGNKEEKTSGEGANLSKTQTVEIVFEKNGSVSTPIIGLEIYPEITGVLIVAEGVNDEKMRLLVINAVAVALNIENSKIEVLSGKSK